MAITKPQLNAAGWGQVLNDALDSLDGRTTTLEGSVGNSTAVTTATMTGALTTDGRTLQAQFLDALGADAAATRVLFSSILGFLASPTVGKVNYSRDFTAATATTADRPNGTDTNKTRVWWFATDGTTTVPTNYVAGDVIRIVRQTV